MKKDLNETEEIFRLMREMLAEVEGLKHIMTGGATTISEKAHKKVQDTVEKAFDPFKRIVLSPEGYKRFKEIDEAPLTEEKEEAIKKFVEETNKFYGTMEDKDWIQEKCNTNKPPTSVPEHPSKGNKLPKEKPHTTDSAMRTRNEIEARINELKIVSRYTVLDRDKIQGWIEALEWILKISR